MSIEPSQATPTPPSTSPATTPPSNISPSIPELAPADRAKMDYQAYLDQQKVQFWRGARWKELVWDRLIFSVTVVLLGALALIPINCWTDTRRNADARALEKFKLDEARQRFFLERRLEALIAISTAMSDVTRVYFAAANSGQGASADATRREYQQSLDKAREVINRSALLFEQAFNEDIDRYYEIHRQMMLLGPSEFSVYREFLADLSTCFDDCCRQQLKDTSDRTELPKRLPVASITYSERIRMKPKEYIETHFEHWKKGRATKVLQ